MPFTCPQCGAAFSADETCQDRFQVSQLAEVEHPAYYAVHHLSVPCYMLQHNVYSRDGWVCVRRLLHQFVHEGLTPQAARRQNRKTLDSGHRTWSLTRGAKLAGVEAVAWTRTVADVRLDTAEHYCADVRRWAESVLTDSEALIRAFG